MRVPFTEVLLEDVVLNKDEDLYFDTETEGLYGKIRLAQFYQDSWPEVILVHNPEPVQLFILVNTVHSVMHVAHYDITTMQANVGTRCRLDNFSCTFYLARLAFPALQEYSLDKVMDHVLKFDPYKRQNLDKKILQKTDWKGDLTEDQLLYAATDVYYLSQVYQAIKAYEESMSYKLDMLSTRYALDFQNNGFPVDQDKANAKYEKIEKRIKEIALPINCNSWRQVRPYIGSNNSDALGLTTLKLHGNVRAGEVNETRKLTKQLSFLDKFMAPRIFGKFLPTARSGRYASKDQNLQQIPRKLKGVFGPEEGRVFLYADYAQIQMRGACILARDHKMEDLFRRGEDVHQHTAYNLFGVDADKEDRQVAKTCNFNLLFGGGAGMLQSILITESEMLIELEGHEGLYAIKRKWLNLWKGIARWQEVGIDNWRSGKIGKTPLGRRYKARMYTDYLAMEVQGFESEVFKLALHYMYPKLKKFDNVDIVNVIHDSFIIEADDDAQLHTEIGLIMAHSMQDAWFEASKCTPIEDLPMPVDVYVGNNWGDIEDGIFSKKFSLE